MKTIVKKIFVLCAFVLGVSATVNAQGFEVRHNNVLLEDGAEVEIKESYENDEGETFMKFIVAVTNISENEKEMRMIREEISVVANTINTMCWDLCMDPEITEANCDSLSSSETTYPYGEMKLNESGNEPAVGTSIINYTFKSRSKGDPTVTVTVKYTYEEPTKVTESTLQDALIVTQSDGERKFKVLTTLTENISGKLEIADLSGRILQTLPIQAGQNNVTFTDVLTDGCYLLILKQGNKAISVRKGVIR